MNNRLRGAVGAVRRRRAGPVRDPLLPALVPADPQRRANTWPRRGTTGPASSGSAPRAARSSTATATCSSTTGPASRCRSTRQAAPKTDRRQREMKQLAELTTCRCDRVRETIHEGVVRSPGAPVTLRTDVGNYLVYYLQENQHLFPGVTVQRVFVRNYPDGTLAAHILGQVGEIDRRTAEGAAVPGPASRATRSARTASRTPTTFLRGKPGLTRSRSTPSASRRRRPAPLAAAGPGRQPEALDQRVGPGSRRSGDGLSSACAAASSRWTSTTAKSSRWAPTRPSNPTSSRNR